MITELLPLLDGWQYFGLDVDIRLKQYKYLSAGETKTYLTLERPGWILGCAVDFVGSKEATLTIKYYDALRGWSAITVTPYGLYCGGLGYQAAGGLNLTLYDEANNHYVIDFSPTIPLPVRGTPETPCTVTFSAYDMDATIYGFELAGIAIVNVDDFVRSLKEVLGGVPSGVKSLL